MDFRYGDAWEQYPIQPGEVWGLDNGSRVAVHDIFKPLPGFMQAADLLFVDPPWNQGNLTAFYTKAKMTDYRSFVEFAAVLFERLAAIGARTCYIEIGNQYVDGWSERLAQLYPVLQRWPVVYYRKHPTNIIRGGQALVAADFTGMDEARVIAKVAQIEDYQVMGDLCMGQGLVGLAAHTAGKPFVGTELNQRRLAVLLQKLAKKGAQVQRYE